MNIAINITNHPDHRFLSKQEWQRSLMIKLTWLLLVCYTLQLIRPVVPVLADLLAHAFNEQQHIMTVHEVHGKFHVHYDRSKNTTHKDTPVYAGNYQQDEHLNMAAAIANIYPVPGEWAVTFYSVYTCHYLYTYHNKEYIPPQC